MTQTDKTLKIDMILGGILPSGELGTAFKRRMNPYKPAEIALARAAYGRIKRLMEFIRNDRSGTTALREHLTHCKAVRDLSPDLVTPLALHECFEIKEFTYYSEKIRVLCQLLNLPLPDKLYDLSRLFSILDPEATRVPHFHLSGAYSPRLKQIITRMSEIHLRHTHLSAERLQQAAVSLQQPALKAELVVSRMQQDIVTVLSGSPFFSISAENFANITFTLTPTAEMLALQQQSAQLKEDLGIAESQVLEDLTNKIAKYAKHLKQAQHTLAALDWEFACARFGIAHNCVIPTLHDKLEITLKDAVNLPVEQLTTALRQRYQKISITLNTKINVLTGPNMGGKTTALKTIGQLCRLASFAIPLPCSKVRLPLFDWIWYNQYEGGSENLSSFAREIVAFNRAIVQKGYGLILLDEFAKGTNPTEGERIAAAVLEYLLSVNCLVFSATHYNAPADVEPAACFAIKGIDEAWFDGRRDIAGTDLDSRLKMLNQAMDYGIVRLDKGQSPPRCAIRIARILGMPSELINKLENQS